MDQPRRAAFHPLGGGLAEHVDVVATLGLGGGVEARTLLRLEDEGAALVDVDPAEAGRAVAIVLEDAALENVVVEGVVGAAALGRRHADQCAQAVDEALGVGELGTASVAPLRDEVTDLVPRHVSCLRAP